MKRTVSITIAIVVALVLLVLFAATMITDWFWFQEVGFQSVFITTLLSKWGLRLIVALFFFLVVYLNLRLTRNHLHIEPETVEEGENVVPIRKYVVDRLFDKKKLNYLFIGASILIALLFSSAASGSWMMVQQFFNRTAFGITDPIFNMDVSFYVFSLPFLRMVLSLAFTSILLAIFAAGVAYFLFGSREALDFRDNKFSYPKIHLSVLLALLFVLKGFDYILDAYGLMNKQGNLVYGPGFTEVNVNLLAFKVLAVLAFIGAVVVIVSLLMKRSRYIVYTLGSLIVVSLVLGSAAPYLVQKIRVEPNEQAVEAPYIKHNIDFTRAAFDLDKIQLKSFEASNLDIADIQENPGTISNIRLWDPSPLMDANTQLQEIRPYYSFLDVDIDRYMIDGNLRQIMVSGREMDKELLSEDAKNWVNKKLRYTHGYGVTMNFVASTTKEGHPNYVIKDIPPTADHLQIDVPQIYYGQAEDDYVIVNTTTEEFDYPSTTGNVSTTYSGSGGIHISNLLTRSLFAFRFADYRMLISDALTDDSKILFRTNIKDRIEKIAPFLAYDSDPYLVVDNGRLVWIQDAFTTTRNFPYSQPMGGMGNYIRNSVKITVDAYDGTVTFYADLENDPIVRSYAGVFPALFEPWDEIPDNLQDHLRYPEDLFNIQAEVYKTYHMTDVTDFYNKEDLWNIPINSVGGEQTQMSASYTIMTLPGNDEPEFVLMLPFTPSKKNNMAAWIAVRCDADNYGEMIVFQFSKQELVYGPAQVEAEIQADSEISQVISLWSQRGSEVIRGNLLVIPINDGILYVQPIFLQSEQNKLPSLKRVIVFHNGKLEWADTLSQSLAALFGADDEIDLVEPPEQEEVESDDLIAEIEGDDLLEGTPGDEGAPGPGEATAPQGLDQLIDRANELFQEAEEKQRQGDWAGYGEAIAELESVLKQLANQ